MKDFALQERIAVAAQKAAGEAVQFCQHWPIAESVNGRIEWEGVVSEYMTTASQHVYSWAVETDTEPQFIAVLKQPPVDSAVTAVRAWLVSRSQ